MRLVWGTVTSVESQAEDIQRLSVSVDGGESGQAVNYLRLSAVCAEGDRVLLNTTAVELSLGTGGTHFVVARLGDAKGVALDAPSGGHVMKLRYTPLQMDVVSVESQESEHHEVMREARSLGGMPVVCCGLHSQMPLVAAAVKAFDSSLRVAYCMTDQAALSVGLSDVVRKARAAGLVDATLTCGQSFGGDLEAVNLHSGLLAARHVAEADVAVVAIGPGVVGTATALGHGGVAQGETINAVHVLEGVPVACLRLSFADERPRHRGVSHHSISALRDITLAPARVAVPALAAEQASVVDDALESAGIWERHVRVDAGSERSAAPDMRNVQVRTMGRGIEQDPAFFFAAFAAGEVAARQALGAS